MPATTERRSAPRFSIIVVARDEVWSLPQLLCGLDGFVERGGELLVVDTGSTDETVAIARRHGCRIELVHDRFDSTLDVAAAAEIERRFARAEEGPLVEAGQRLFHFGDARQLAGCMANNPFVLQLDACDELFAFDLDALDRHIEAGGVRAFEYDQLYGNARLRIARFYDRGRYHWEGRVHEILEPTLSADAAPASTVRCDPTQLLVRHNKDEEKPRHYLAGLALQVMERPEKPRWWHYLGRELYYGRQYRSAIAVLEAHVAMDSAWQAERSQSLCFMGESLEALRQTGDAKTMYQRAAELDPSRREPLLQLATLFSRQGEFEAAAETARRALTIPHTSALPEPDANYTWIPHSILYWSLFWLGRKDEARTHWEICLSLAPQQSRAREYARLFAPAGNSAAASAPPATGPRVAAGRFHVT